MGDAVLVTGAGGFIGGHLVARLRAEGVPHVRAVDLKPVAAWHQAFDDVENVEADLRGLDACRTVCRGVGQVYALAADMGGMGFIETHKAACMLSVLITTHVLVAARDAGVGRVFYASSACVYAAGRQDRPDVAPLREEDAYPAMPEDGYGWEKLFGERMHRHFREDFGLETRIARLHNVYGPHGTWEGGREKAPAAICRKVVEAVRSGEPGVEVWGDGRQTRSFLYVDDAVEGIRRIMDSPCTEPLNLGSEETIDIDGLVDLVASIAGADLERRHRLDAPLGVRGRSSDNTRIRQALGWAPSIPLRDGLARTYAWIRERHLERHPRWPPEEAVSA